MSGNDHLGSAAVQEVQLFGMLGLSHRVNALVILPYVHWSQTAVEEDAHHRNKTIQGFRDVRLGLRYVVSNTLFGPGERLFLGLTLALPTATSYAANPFATEADSLDHSHFALGNATATGTMYGEWWRRSEFPWVTGLLVRYRPRSPQSSLGFQPGSRLAIDLHAIGHTHRLWRSYPYLTLGLRREGGDLWAGTPAPNSGGLWLEGSAGLDLELTENFSGVLRLSGPLWTRLTGSQQTAAGLNLTLRFKR